MRAGLFLAPRCEFFRTLPATALLAFATTAYANTLDIGKIVEAPAFPSLIEAGRVPEGMTMVSDFIQRLPYDGEPATRHTVVYLGYDADKLYVVFNAFDDPALVRANLSSRENIDEDDTVSLTLDAFGDQRRAFVFESNPLGVQRDQTFVEGQGFDPTFDTVWRSQGSLTEWGYVVLMELPFKSLRFNPDGSTPWRVSFKRTVQRDNGEISTWPHISTQVDGRLNQAANMDGISGVSPGRNLQFIPYATVRSFRGIDDTFQPQYVEEDFDPEFGIDVKKVWNDSIVADLTINPDFSQIESDQPQVTVNQRFEVFFPERRPFFLENADFFNTPIDLLFTRRIADPGFGGRVTAKLGPWSIGTLIADDEAPGKLLEPSDPNTGDNALFATARISRDIGEQSRVGGMFVQREFGGDRNTVLGVDGRIKWNERWVSSVQAAASKSTNAGQPVLNGSAGFFSLNRSGRHFNYFGRVRSLSDDFDAQAGFVPRTGVIDMVHFASLFWWPDEGSKLVRWGPEVFVSQVWDRDDKRLDELFEVSLEWEFVGQTDLEINVNRSRERLTSADFPVLISDKDFDTDFVNIEYGTAMWKTLALEGDTSIGTRINFSPLPGEKPEAVDWMGSSLEMSYRPLSQLSIDTTFLYNRFDDEDSGALVVEDFIGRARINWQFSKELSMRTIVQYERTEPNPLETTINDRKNWNVDLLLTYRVNPWTAIYLGYNQNRQNLLIDENNGTPTLIRTDDLHKDSEQLILKVSYLFRR